MDKIQKWQMIRNRNARCKKEYDEYIGTAVEEEDSIMKEHKELYEEMMNIAREVNNMITPNQLEIEYQECIKYILEDYGIDVTMEKEECVRVDNTVYCNVRLDIYMNEMEYIIELKINKNKKGIQQLKEYMRGLNKNIGFLIQYVKGKVSMLMIFRHVDLHYYIYDGGIIYKHE